MIHRIPALIALTLAVPAFAQTSIVADKDCGAVTLHAASNATLPEVARAYVYLPSQRIAVTPVATARSLDFNANVPDEGVVMAAVDFKPVVSGNETRTDHAKAMIFCSATTPPADWQRSAELGLEIYPQGWNGPRPHMKAGDTMDFIAVDKTIHKLLNDVPMDLYRVGSGKIASGTPGNFGFMKFSYPQPGWYMVVATYRRPDAQQQGHWLVDTSTLTFEVK